MDVGVVVPGGKVMPEADRRPEEADEDGAADEKVAEEGEAEIPGSVPLEDGKVPGLAPGFVAGGGAAGEFVEGGDTELLLPAPEFGAEAAGVAPVGAELAAGTAGQWGKSGEKFFTQVGGITTIFRAYKKIIFVNFFLAFL